MMDLALELVHNAGHFSSCDVGLMMLVKTSVNPGGWVNVETAGPTMIRSGLNDRDTTETDDVDRVQETDAVLTVEYI